MAFCSNCGTKLEDGAKFCLNCGTRLAEDTAQPQQVYQQPAQPQQVYQQSTQQQQVYQQPVQPQQQINVNMPPQGAYQQAPGVNKNPWSYFTGVFKKYAVFTGRARRAEYWYFALFNFIASVVIGVVERLAGPEFFYIAENVGLLTTLYSIAILLPSFGVAIRRMHDCDKSGWYILIPIYGWIVLPCTAGTIGPNRFGPDPKQIR
jgi:uncharacterized membrane protein YhaH (DUF805 family)